MKYIVRMSAGLANRMLQYTFYLYLKEQGKDVYIDNKYKYTKIKTEDIKWERIFPYAPINQASNFLIFKYGGGYTLLDKIRRHYLTLFSKVWIAPNANAVPTDEDLLKYRYFIGVYQDSKIADTVKDKIQKYFHFPPFERNSLNAEFANKMKSENSVSIHFRKGKDYLKCETYKNTCPVDYYRKAVKIIQNKVKNPVFYVFTDNPEWVKANFTDVEYILINNNPSVGWGNHFDLQLMSCCKHNIIANSTYSWWGAFLNPNPDKIVIDPRYWFNPQLPKYKNIENKTACKGWILI